jgi:hypothetical protein
MNSHLLAAILLCICLFGCSKKSTPTATPSSVAQTQPPKADNLENATCSKHQMQQDGCGEYKVLSYDATWKNANSNKGEFVLEREGLTIRAYCGSENCYIWSEAVGKSVIADRSITDLITHYLPDCEDPLYVQNALEYYKRTTGRNVSVAQVCDQTLIVEKVEVKGVPKKPA